MKERKNILYSSGQGGYIYTGLHRIKGVSINEVEISIALQHKASVPRYCGLAPPTLFLSKYFWPQRIKSSARRTPFHVKSAAVRQSGFRMARDIRTWKCFSSGTPLLWNEENHSSFLFSGTDDKVPNKLNQNYSRSLAVSADKNKINLIFIGPCIILMLG